MLVSNSQTATQYRLQAVHIREFLATVRNDDRLRAILINVAARFDRLAIQADANRRPHRAKRKARPAYVRMAERAEHRRVQSPLKSKDVA
jgi:hypothetical protein